MKWVRYNRQEIHRQCTCLIAHIPLFNREEYEWCHTYMTYGYCTHGLYRFFFVDCNFTSHHNYCMLTWCRFQEEPCHWYNLQLLFHKEKWPYVYTTTKIKPGNEIHYVHSFGCGVYAMNYFVVFIVFAFLKDIY